ncbi:hypothetical protein C5167_018146 [Papaver somniferum]|uniref:Fe2OG dioxygenase domain-containing protein n=1 Tax=Papaver somniferum TaxID=3469 RepID=A0A4Y7ILX1_PAPSO|nr:1-aminocyclopropane-1-carboxylate oxidase homolog 1-like isoform X2 [Papaver somniferum]RZC49717.1 hypothetical protein C5167_018146 [Papaver somniferum]
MLNGRTAWSAECSLQILSTLKICQKHPEILCLCTRDTLFVWGDILIELLSEGLRLHPQHLKGLDCTKNMVNIGHYYPACPEPELTLGGGKHSDPTFFTILLQDDIGGLQFLHHNCWVGVTPVPGALLVNIGDLLQVISNERFKSAEHRVVANLTGPRISVASFFSGSKTCTRLYSPLKN